MITDVWWLENTPCELLGELHPASTSVRTPAGISPARPAPAMPRNMLRRLSPPSTILKAVISSRVPARIRDPPHPNDIGESDERFQIGTEG